MSRRIRWSALPVVLMLSLMLGAIVKVTPAATLTITNGFAGGFEIDGNETLDGTGTLDWKTVSPIVTVDDTLDSGFRGSSKELEPSNWVCNTGGANAPQGNVLRVYRNIRTSGAGTFLDLAWIREATGNGNVIIEFELNQAAQSDACKVTRVAGDLLVAFDFPGGQAVPLITVSRWVPGPPVSPGMPEGTWMDASGALGLAASGAVNTATILPADEVSGLTIAPGDFGEVTLDLTGLFAPNSGFTCSSFTTLNARSRSSNAENSALQDRVVPVPVSLCPDTPQPGHTPVPDAGPDPDPATDLGGHDHHGGDPIDTTTAGTPSGPGSGDNSSGSPSGQPSTPGQIPGTPPGRPRPVPLLRPPVDVESNVAAAPGAPVSNPSGVRSDLPAGSSSGDGPQSLLLLPRTGAGIAMEVLLGLILTFGGASLLVTARRRRSFRISA